MNIFLWVLQVLLAVAFALSGFFKVSQSKDQLAPRMPYVEDFPAWVIKLIGTLEILAAIGLVLPAATGIAPILTPLAATGLALLMIGAMITHGRRGEWQSVVFNVVLLILAAIVAWGRFGPYSF